MAKQQPQAPQARPDTGLRARLKPYNPDEGHVLQSLTVTALGGRKYEGVTGFYMVSKAEAEVLRGYRQDGEHEAAGGTGPKAFDVCTVAAAEEIIQQELRAKALGIRPGTTKGAPIAAARDPGAADLGASRAAPPAPVAPARVGKRTKDE
jgi:hypothetical protein